ncbi:MAG: DUF2332 family protein [Nocardioidaceae bacterium]
MSSTQSRGSTSDLPTTRRRAARRASSAGPVASPTTPRSFRSWRHLASCGVDLNPLDPADPDTAAWLTALIWPEHEHRSRRLTAAFRLAAASTIRIDRGDLRGCLAELLAGAPADATRVVLHSATLTYLTAEDRATVTDGIVASGARWISFEGRGIVRTARGLSEPVTPDAMFVAALDRVPVGRARQRTQ